MAATKLLANMFKKMNSEPVEGIAVELEDDNNLFEWKIYIEGPKDTLYEGGIFQMSMKFPQDYPMSPPELKFISDFWHPNDTGLVCISILHPPVADELSGELPEERWLPTQTVGTILLSVISLLSAPNFSSPANVDANVEWRNDPKGFAAQCKHLVEKSLKELPPHVKIPHPDSNPEEREKQIAKYRASNTPVDLDEFAYDDNVDPNEVYESDDEEGSHSESEEEKKEDPPKPKTVTKEEKKKPKKEKSKRKPLKKGKEEVEESDTEKRKKKKCVVM